MRTLKKASSQARSPACDGVVRPTDQRGKSIAVGSDTVLDGGDVVRFRQARGVVVPVGQPLQLRSEARERFPGFVAVNAVITLSTSPSPVVNPARPAVTPRPSCRLTA
nr:hypothetical protein [Kutzneria sp. CA-103260]